MVLARDPEIRMRVGAHQIRGRTVVIPIGEIDIATSPLLSGCLDRCVGHVVVDLSGVTFLDSSGIRVLVVHRKRLGSDGGSLELRDPQPIVRAAMDAVGLGAWISS